MSGFRPERDHERAVEFRKANSCFHDDSCLPAARGAEVQMLWWKSPSSGKFVTTPVYIDKDWNSQGNSRFANIEQVVIHTHGKQRDAGDTWKEMNDARKMVASEHREDRSASTLVIAPQFFNGLDREKLGGSGGQNYSEPNLLIWKGIGWGDGSYNNFPHGSKTVSSFEAFDALLDYFNQHRQEYPRLRRIVFSGHSLGGQLVHRYSILGDATSRPNIGTADAPVQVSFVSMNPGSFLYFTPERSGPRSKDDNEYKFGFDNLQTQLSLYPSIGQHPERGAAFYLERMLSQRTVHFLSGASDNGLGDQRPPALAQGTDRFDRAQHYYRHLAQLLRQAMEQPDFRPSKLTTDWVPDTGHDSFAMVTSAAGMRYIFG